ncbi:ARM repeat-containing protein [Venustampulla echinocandica]|uniref:ARM repeat-containing protein n=1 Tax=Venustampulla echinocandica TaxID=2656787 RepID=A0A370TA99_9HELO|nr:ARM repeat-containing protein [Venustampulla echinocandica]RDL30734.1 ARM repeat-containing protein [Venustampulla echinocandica]
MRLFICTLLDGVDIQDIQLAGEWLICAAARELTLDAAQSARSSRGSGSTKTIPAAKIKILLDSRNDRDVLEGLRKVISPCLTFFSSVVKNVASPNIEIKKLVYIYLLNHAEQEPDLALLSINTIQKSLSDGNPQVRALALKTMSGIRVPVISQIVSLAIKKGLSDMSPYVRKAAALAIPKCYRLDPNTLPQLLDYLSTLLGDRQYYVAGAAVKAFMEICPDRTDLIHKHYRSLVKKLVDMDEWSQLATLRLMTIYSRRCFPKRTRRIKKSNGAQGFYGDEEGEEEDTGEIVQILDPDLELLLKSIKPLLQSRNSAVVVAVARCYVNLGTPQYTNSAIGPLVALLRGPQDIQHIALYNIVSICITRPEAFVKYSSHFLVRSTDPPQVWELKLEILTLIFPHCDPYLKSIILNELEHFSRGSDRELVREAVRAIGRCAQSDAKTSTRCLSLLLKQITSLDGNLVAESLTVIRHLIQQDPTPHTNTIIRLAKNLDTATNPRARASIIWLVGEFATIDGENNIAADVLRILAKGFADEAEPAKLQIVLLAAKVYLHHLNSITENDSIKPTPAPAPAHEYLPTAGNEGFAEMNEPQESAYPVSELEPQHPIVKLWNYVLLLARYDTSYDLRDRTRLYKALLAVPSSTQLASLMLLAPKPVPHTPSPSESRTGFTLGSASLVIGEESGLHGLRGYEALPDWVEAGREPDPSLRDVDAGKLEYDEKRLVPAGERLDSAMKDTRGESPSKANGFGAAGGKEKTLDDWLAEDEGEEEETEEESEEEDEDSEGEESSEEISDAEEDESSDDDDKEHDRLVK